MSTSIDDESVLNEQTWRAWEHKRKLRREEKAARKMKRAATIILVLLATVGTFYLLVVK
ncbi:MAG TPA: hypothetical protein VKU01_12030 [Bryobacteraceae bacterium]|nr:hypothetical protein [Bryobacteraceae bacterium]